MNPSYFQTSISVFCHGVIRTMLIDCSISKCEFDYLVLQGRFDVFSVILLCEIVI